MIFDYALELILLAVAANIGNRDGFMCAIGLLALSVAGDFFVETTSGIEYYAIYAGIAFGYMFALSILPRSRIRDEMMILQIICMTVQFLGLALWVLYYGPEVYLILVEAVFAIEIARLVANGFRTGMARDSRRGPNDNLHDHSGL